MLFLCIICIISIVTIIDTIIIIVISMVTVMVTIIVTINGITIRITMMVTIFIHRPRTIRRQITWGSTWGLFKIRGPSLWVPIIRIIVLWGLHWGPPMLGLESCKRTPAAAFMEATRGPCRMDSTSASQRLHCWPVGVCLLVLAATLNRVLGLFGMF